MIEILSGGIYVPTSWWKRHKQETRGDASRGSSYSHTVFRRRQLGRSLALPRGEDSTDGASPSHTFLHRPFLPSSKIDQTSGRSEPATAPASVEAWRAAGF